MKKIFDEILDINILVLKKYIKIQEKNIAIIQIYKDIGVEKV